MKLVRSRPSPNGFNDPARPPIEIPDLPLDVGDLPDDDLMELFNQFTAWASYLSVETAKKGLIEDAAEDAITELGAWFYLQGDNTTVARAKANASESMKNARFEYRVAKNVRKLIEAKFLNCDRNAKALSRELTRRTTIAEGDRGRRYGA